ncbi:MAG: hypothetical protein IJW31_05990 [Lentisphaeria bacterium]|nr:hypothetical protein [Lentisphaeria bacterium]
MEETIMNLLEEAEGYFANDLRESYWKNLTDNEKNGAIKIALLDVKSILNICNRECDLEDKLVRAAVFEQAIHLVIQRILLEQEKELTRCDIDGVGSESYAINDSKKEYYLKERVSNRTVSLLAMPDVRKMIKIIR